MAAVATPPASRPPVPAPYQKLARQQARKLLTVEAQTRIEVRRAAREVTAALVLELDRRRQDDSHTARDAAILLLLLGASRRMQTRMQARIEDGRERARLAAIGRLRAELALGGIALALAHALAPRTDTDSAYAAAAAAAYASAWAGAALYLVTEALRTDKSPTQAVVQATDLKESNLERIVVTETARAYNDQHKEDAEELADADPEAMAILVRRWDAMLDARVCDDCASHDGETAPIGESFAGGDEPGYLHPNCRCESSLVPL
jgi:hypothetical protein